MEVGSITATVRATADAFKAVINGVKKDIQDLANNTKDQAKKAQDAANEIAQGSKKVADQTKEATAELSKIAVIASAAFYGMVRGVGDVITVTNRFNNSLLGLESTATSFRMDLKATTEAAQDLAEDGLMTVGQAATGLKNLLRSRYGLDEAITLMNRFKDSAAFGRQASLSFGEAITSATEGIKNGNSILVDNAGVTKNLSVMLEEAGFSAQDLMRASTDAGVRMAIYNGIIKETNSQMGDAAKLSNTLSGGMSRFATTANMAKVSMGNALTPAVQDFYRVLNLAVGKVGDFVGKQPELVSGLTTSAIYVTALVAAFASVVVVLATVKRSMETLNITLLKSPWGWILLAVGAAVAILYKYAAATQKAKEQQELYNKELEETARIKKEGIQVNEIAQREEEIKQLKQLTQAYEEQREKVEEAKRKQQQGAQSVNRNQLVMEAIREEQALKTLQEQLMEMGFTYESAKERVDALSGALQRANKINFAGIESEVMNFQSISNTNDRILESIDIYTELSSKKSLDAKETERLASASQFLVDVLGNDILVRKNVDGTMQINIEALKNEATIIKSSAKDMKEKTIQAINSAKQELEAEITKTNGIIKAIDKQIDKYIELYKAKLAAMSVDPDNPAPTLSGPAAAARRMIAELEASKANNEKLIAESKAALSKLAELRYDIDHPGSESSSSSSSTKTSETYKNKALEDALEIYEYKKHMNQLTLEDELKTLQQILSQHAKTADEKRRLEMMIYDIKKEMTDRAVELAKRQYEEEKALIDEKKYYNELSLEQELAAWEELREKYKENAEYMKEIDREIYRVKKELLDKQVEATRQAIEQTYNAEMDALDQQQEYMDEYYSNRIDAINKEKEARLDAIDEQIKKLDELTQKENRQKQEQQDQAEIESLRDRIARAQDPLEKFSLQQELDQKLKERDERLKQEKREDEKERLQELKDNISDQYDARIEGLRRQQEAERKFMEQRKQMVEQSYKQMLSSLDQFASDNLTTLKQNQDDIISMFNDNASKYYDSAQNLGEMFAQGLESQVGRVKEAAAQLAQAAADVLELHSPAKEGPLSKLGTWWKAFVPTLMQGMDMNMLKGSVINTIQLSKYVVPAVFGSTGNSSSSNSGIYVEHLEILADDVLQYANVMDGLKYAITKGIRRR